jgi:hypothetical protein
VIGLALVAAALAAEVLQSVPTGEIDWTRQRLVVEASSDRGSGAIRDLKAVEQAARAELAPRLEAAARAVRFSGEADAGELLDGGGVVSEMLGDNLLRWRVTEARYFTSGRVELRAELELQPWLSPAVLGVADGHEDPTLESRHSGVLIDARGLDLTPSFAPRVLSPTGAPLYSAAQLSQEAAARLTPVVWVTDPADAAAGERAGDAPLFLRAASVSEGCDVVLDARDAALVEVLAGESDLLARARVVVVIDP